MKKVLFFVGTGHSLTTKLIQTVTKSKFSHVGMVFMDDHYKWVGHSTVGGVQAWLFPELLDAYSNLEFYEMNVSDEDHLRAYRIAYDYLCGTALAGYDQAGFVGAGLKILFGGKKNRLDVEGRLTCTEVMGNTILLLEEELETFDVDFGVPNLITPGACQKLFSTDRSFIRVFPDKT